MFVKLSFLYFDNNFKMLKLIRQKQNNQTFNKIENIVQTVKLSKIFR